MQTPTDHSISDTLEASGPEPVALMKEVLLDVLEVTPPKFSSDIHFIHENKVLDPVVVLILTTKLSWLVVMDQE